MARLRPRTRLPTEPRPARLATFADLQAFVERDGWTREPNLARGGARTGDHRRYRKELPDGTVLRTKVPHDLQDEIGIGLFRHILRDQLRVGEDRFWEVVRGRATAAPGSAHLSPETIPGWLVVRLIVTAGYTEGEVRAMTPAEARAAWETWQARPR
jgi:predicted RNA binding protein YcfA (HicA-like mRNA interferase family)